MNTLFDIAPVLPGGFNYDTNFISEEEEIKLVKLIEHFDLQPMKFHEYEAKRKVISFGQGWSFTEQKLKDGNPIPSEFDFLVEKIAPVTGKKKITLYHAGNFKNGMATLYSTV